MPPHRNVEVGRIHVNFDVRCDDYSYEETYRVTEAILKALHELDAMGVPTTNIRIDTFAARVGNQPLEKVKINVGPRSEVTHPETSEEKELKDYDGKLP